VMNILQLLYFFGFLLVKFLFADLITSILNSGVVKLLLL